MHLARPAPWAATGAAVVHLAGLVGVGALLLVLGFGAPRLPLLVVPALALDFARARGWSRTRRATLFVGVLYLVYLAVLNITGSDETPSLGQALVGLPAALAGAWVALAGRPAPRPSRRGVRAASAILPLMIALVVAPVALAHDPGNGPDAGHVAWTVESRGRALAVTARADGGAFRMVPVALVA